jgi:thymidylate synthase (FAD)
MKLISPKVEYLPQDTKDGIFDVYKQIELAGRTCYKSEDKITEDSAEEFVQRMIKSGHLAMLEHGTVYLKFDINEFGDVEEYDNMIYHEDPYSRVNDDNVDWVDWEGFVYVTTNLRVIHENNLYGDLEYLVSPCEHHDKRFTFKFTTNRGVSHELVRHRVFSFAQESTRYCNYSKKKFGNQITYIKPKWYKSIPKHIIPLEDDNFATKCYEYRYALAIAEEQYFKLLKLGSTPQEARAVLPNDLKTEVIMTGFIFDWEHFFNLRYFGTSGNPHPDMLELTRKAKNVLMKNKLWVEIYPTEVPSNKSKNV